MANISRLGNAEGRFCGVLAAAIARQVTEFDNPTRPGFKGAVFFHYFTGVLEEATEALSELGLLAPERQGTDADGLPHLQQALTMDSDAMPGFLGQHVRAGDPRIAKTVAAFIGVACDFGGLSTERTPFVPPPPFVDAMRALARRGYAEQIGDRYRWTDKIGPAMRASYFWNEALRSGATLAREAEETEAELAWRTMPETIRRRFFSTRPVELIEFVRVLCQCWKDGAWHPTSQDDWTHLSGEVSLARRIIEIADGQAARRL